MDADIPRIHRAAGLRGAGTAVRTASMGIPGKSEFDVCLVVETSSMTLADLAARLEVAPTDGSHDIGDPHLIKSRGFWKSTVWQLCSSLDGEASLDDHLAALAARIPHEKVRSELPADARIYISIGVFSDAQIPVANIPPRGVAVATSIGAGIEVRFYSPEMES